ncbi:MAG: hypothetical protein A3B68_02540 [Candidatus Melainabacteria bacterium RIFCSPHIGHO2_02_FULL_34_12]|nr:MAG: hypothetical protein A3B68_02540 [Candidatus Melainabacteria bacterium RIFCSPHIGHO2_02_FULL_34_12]
MSESTVHHVMAPALFSVFDIFKRMGKFNGLDLRINGNKAQISGHDCSSTGCSLLKSILESEGYKVSPENIELGVI